MNNEIEKKEPGEIAVVLDKLSKLLERAIAISEENRTTARDNYDYFSKLMKDSHVGSDTISEDGVLEKSTLEAAKILISSAKTLEAPIAALTRVLTAKMHVDAISKLGDGGITKPINIDDYK